MVRAASGPLRVLLLVLAAYPMVAMDEVATLTLTPATVRPGDPVTATGSGFAGCRWSDPPHKDGDKANLRVAPYISVHWGDPDETSEFAKTTLDAGGFHVDVPTDALALGPHRIVAECIGDSVRHPIAAETLQIAVIDPPPPTSSSVPPSSTHSRSSSSPVVTPSVTHSATQGGTSATDIGPTTVPTTYATGGGGGGPGSGSTAKSKVADWVVVIGVVGALVALTALGRRLFRGRTAPPYQPQHTTRVPVVRAVARPGVPGPVELRDHGPGHSVSIRVVVRQEPGEPVVRYSTGGRPR